MSCTAMDIGQQFLLLMPCSRYPWQEAQPHHHNFSCLKQGKLSLLCCPATDYNCCPAEFILTKGKKSEQKKGRTNNKSLTIVMSNLYLSSIAWLSWHPASSCQISALSASGTPLFTRVDNPFGLTTRLLCLKQRWTFSCYTSTTGVKIKMKSIKNL